MIASSILLSSRIGRVLRCTEISHQYVSRSSSASSVANGASNCTIVLSCACVTFFTSYDLFTSIINLLTAVLNLYFCKSSVTHLIVLCNKDSRSSLVSSLNISGNLLTLSKNLCTPWSALSFQFLSASTGHINIRYVLNESLLYFAITSSGSITFPYLFHILRPSCASTIP